MKNLFKYANSALFCVTLLMFCNGFAKIQPRLVIAQDKDASNKFIEERRKAAQDKINKERQKEESIAKAKKNVVLAINAKLISDEKKKALNIKLMQDKKRHELEAKSKLIKLKIKAIEEEIRLLMQQNNKVANVQNNVVKQVAPIAQPAKINKNSILATHIKKAPTLQNVDAFMLKVSQKYNG